MKTHFCDVVTRTVFILVGEILRYRTDQIIIIVMCALHGVQG